LSKTVSLRLGFAATPLANSVRERMGAKLAAGASFAPEERMRGEAETERGSNGIAKIRSPL
jgi:hypothetical protein